MVTRRTASPPAPSAYSPTSNKIHLGVRQFLALNRKFDVAYTDRTDLDPADL